LTGCFFEHTIVETCECDLREHEKI
jgi:hypothetical protein